MVQSELYLGLENQPGDDRAKSDCATSLWTNVGNTPVDSAHLLPQVECRGMGPRRGRDAYLGPHRNLWMTLPGDFGRVDDSTRAR